MTRFLIVDDKEENLYYLQVLLSAQGYRVDAARHGAEALVLARSQPPDLVVSDLLMPVMDGYTLLRHWKADPLLRDIPFVVYTATYTEAEDERLALSLGADGFILKPAEPEDFMARLHEIQAQIRTAAPLVAQPESDGDGGLLKLYSETLIRKLEEKTLQLELTNRALQADIVERRRAEATLRISEANLAAAQSIAHFGSWEWELGDTGDGALHWSDEMYRIAGLVPREVAVSNQLLLDLVADEDRELIRTARRSVLEGLEPCSVVYRLRRPDGEMRVVHELAQRFLDEQDGASSRIIGTAHDITDQRNADEALRASERAQRRLSRQLDAEHARLVDAQRVAKLATWESDIDTGEMDWSNEAHHIFETDATNLHPLQSDFLAVVHPDDRRRVVSVLEESLRDGSAGALEHRLLMPDGRIKYVEERWQYVHDSAGLPRRALGTCRDVTEQRLAQAESQRTADLLRAVADNISDAVFVKDVEGRYLLFNKGAARLLGQPEQAVLGKDDTQLFSADQARTIIAGDREMMRSGQASVGEEELTTDGITRTYLSAKAPYFDVEGRVLGLVGISRDISQRKLRESVLRNSEAELRLLIDTMPHIAWVADADGVVVHFNRQWLRYTGIGPEDGRVDHGHSRIHPQEREQVARLWEHCRATGDDFEIEYRLLAGEVEYRWMLGRAQAMRGEDGRIVKWFGTATDIDDIKRSVDVVRSSEERFRLLSRASNDAIWDWDLVRNALWWNETFEVVFGYDRDELEPGIESWTSRIHPDDRVLIVNDLNRAIDRGDETWARDYRFRKADGQYVEVSDRGHVIRDDKGVPLRMVGGLIDMSERLALEEQLRQSQRLESVGQLTGGIAHDFNNLLTVILGNAELLAEQLAGEPALEGLARMVVRAGQRGAELTQRLLAFARKQTLDPRAIDVNQLLQGFDGLLRRTLGNSVDVSVKQSDHLWPALVDPAQLENAVLNLCLNARDAMPGGGWLGIETANVHLNAEGTDQPDDVRPGEYVMLAISDAGSGIAPEHLRRVFEPFFTTKRDGKGTGLGLAMVYGFVKQSGGHVYVYSELGEGTTVKLYLPRARAAAVAVERVDEGRVCAGGDETILLVEDDDLVRRYAGDQLRSLGYRVIECANANAALQALDEHPSIALLFTDVVMPGMSGRQLADSAVHHRPGLRVLYSSGYTEDAMIHHGRLEPGLQLLNKPYRYADLADAVRRALTSSG